MQIIILESLGLSEEAMQPFISEFEKNGHNVVFYEQKSEDIAVNIERAKDADVLMLVNMPISKELLAACSHIKMISVAFTGIDHIDMDYCKANRIVVCNAAGYSTTAVAELTVASAISLLRNFKEADLQTRRCEGRNGMLGNELAGKTVGVVGTGAIGLRVAELFHYFGCNIIAYSRTAKPIDYIEYVKKAELFRRADIITLHMPLTPETTSFVDREAFMLMKNSAILINTARGTIVDIPSLADALKNSALAGAAIDVYEKEPPLSSNHLLFDVPNAILLPHIGYATHEAIVRRTKIVFENIQKWEQGAPQNLISL